MTDAKLKSLVERVKDLIEQQKTIGADITQACKDAKETNPDVEPAMVRFAARELLMDTTKRRQRDEKRDKYLHAIGLAAEMVSNGDVSLREAAKACGVSKSSVHRALAVPDVSPEWTDFEYVPVREMTADDLGDPLWVVDRDRAKFRDRVRTIASSIKQTPVLAVPAGSGTGTECGPLPAPAAANPVADTRTFDEITGPLPAHLRRERAAT